MPNMWRFIKDLNQESCPLERVIGKNLNRDFPKKKRESYLLCPYIRHIQLSN